VLRPFSQGSGFIIDESGRIATNRHVVHDADVISVILSDGTQHDAKLVQSDVRMDLAVIRIDAVGLPTVKFGDHGKVRVNQWVFACGNPFGLANRDGQASITYGVVSALGRYMTERLGADRDLEYYGNMIETSAAINPGSSGGPLFNLEGEVIGVVTAIETTTGVSEGHGFAIPMDRNIRCVIDALREGRPVRYGFLGVSVRDVDPAPSKLVVDGRAFVGALLDEINGNDSPAGRAGLKSGDVVVEFDGSPVENSDHLVRLVGFTPVGTSVKVTFVRGGVKREASVTVGDRFELLGRANRRE
jgi:serine protease Do